MYSAYVTTITNLRKHTNADRLMCTEIYGSNVIVDTSYSVGDRVIYFPVDGQLSEEFATDNNLVRRKDENGDEVGGYLDPSKRNIKAIKLRGEKSDGLVLPLSVLERYGDISGLVDGDKITVFGGHEICQKYIPRSNQRQRSKTLSDKPRKSKLVNFPFFTQHVDTEQLAYNRAAFKKGDTIYLTLKQHGSSGRTMNAIKTTVKKRPDVLKKLFNLHDKVTNSYEVVTGSRRVVLGGAEEDDFCEDNMFRKKYHDYFVNRLPKGMEVFYEIVGWVDEDTPIMPRCQNSKVKDKAFSKTYGKETIFNYGCERGENNIYVYRITMTNEDGETIELPTEEMFRWCEKLGVNHVMLLDKFLYTTWEDLNERCNKWLDIPDPIGKTHVSEGVVVRIDNRPKFTAYKTKSYYFKVLEGIIKETADAPDMEEAQELIETVN